MADTYLNAAQRGGTGPNGLPSLTIDEAAAQLTRDAVSWGTDWGTAATVSYAYRSSAPGSMPEDTAGFSRFTIAQINATELALQSWSDVANITFVRVGSGSSGSSAYSNSATILLGNYSSGMDGAAAFTYFPGSTAYSSFDGDLWVNSTLSYNANPTFYDYGQLVLVHELGHAIGLDHPGDYNAGPDIDITYENSAAYFEDSMQYSVMSYFYETYTGADYGYYYPATVMLDDIAAAQRLYGANMSTRTGDTTYGFHSNSGRAWFTASSSSDPLIFAVWDAGGTDTFDFSGYASNQKIDLGQGNFSNVGGLIGNVAIAKGATIENAIGGSGADTIIGNSAANRLQGNAGADTLTGGAGADVFVVTAGGGADVIKDFVVGTDKIDATAYGAYQSIVQSGANTVITFASGVTETLQNVTASTVTSASFIGLTAAPPSPPPPPAPTDQIIYGSESGDVLNGGTGDDTLYGYAGADQLDGKTGADAMYGGAGNDTYWVDNAGDTVHENAGDGSDTVVSTVSFALSSDVENLTLGGTAAINGVGNDGANTLKGNEAANVLEGGAGNDTLDGRGGADTLKGGLGDDIYYVDHVQDVIVENAGAGLDVVFASVSTTLSANVERLTLTGAAELQGTGNELGNTIYGNGAANTLYGLEGRDRLYGSSGDDILYGGGGKDTLTGGAGADEMHGGAGDDIYYIDGLSDQVMENGGDGIDTIISPVSYILGANVENLVLDGAAAFDGTGNSLGNRLDGNDANNVLKGAGSGDQLFGNGGDDVLIGGSQGDRLTGGQGSDTFLYRVLTDSTVTQSDRIFDFSPLVDKIDLSQLDANTRVSGDQAFTWATSFTHVAGQAVLAYDGSSTTTLTADVDGDGVADFRLLITGHLTDGSGFIL